VESWCCVGLNVVVVDQADMAWLAYSLLGFRSLTVLLPARLSSADV